MNANHNLDQNSNPTNSELSSERISRRLVFLQISTAFNEFLDLVEEHRQLSYASPFDEIAQREKLLSIFKEEQKTLPFTWENDAVDISPACDEYVGRVLDEHYASWEEHLARLNVAYQEILAGIGIRFCEPDYPAPGELPTLVELQDLSRVGAFLNECIICETENVAQSAYTSLVEEIYVSFRNQFLNPAWVDQFIKNNPDEWQKLVQLVPDINRAFSILAERSNLPKITEASPIISADYARFDFYSSLLRLERLCFQSSTSSEPYQLIHASVPGHNESLENMTLANLHCLSSLPEYSHHWEMIFEQLDNLKGHQDQVNCPALNATLVDVFSTLLQIVDTAHSELLSDRKNQSNLFSKSSNISTAELTAFFIDIEASLARLIVAFGFEEQIEVPQSHSSALISFSLAQDVAPLVSAFQHNTEISQQLAVALNQSRIFTDSTLLADLCPQDYKKLWNEALTSLENLAEQYDSLGSYEEISQATFSDLVWKLYTNLQIALDQMEVVVVDDTSSDYLFAFAPINEAASERLINLYEQITTFSVREDSDPDPAILSIARDRVHITGRRETSAKTNIVP